MKLTKLKFYDQFMELKKGDILICEFFRDTYKLNRRTRFASYDIVENKRNTNEIILQKHNNIYFNYNMYLDGKSGNLKNVSIVTIN